MPISRRTFLVAGGAAGGGLALGFYLWRQRGRRNDTPRPDAYVRVNADDTIVLSVDESEMGQGVTTALPMILAEEMDADWSRVTYELAPTDPARFGNQWTASSSSVRRGYRKLRRAGAAARHMLVGAAASQWGVPAAECTTAGGAVVHASSGRSLRYGELSAAAALQPVPDEPALKDPKDFRLIGTSVARLDLPAKVDGSAVFGIDVAVPDMLVAQVVRPPVFGAAVASVDDSAATAVAGVRSVVQIPGGVAVIADHFWAAQQGRRALRVTWNEGNGARLDSKTIESSLSKLLTRGKTLRDDGDADSAMAGAETRIEATFAAPYLAHAPMEPLNCTAHVRGDSCELWVPSQSPIGAREETAAALGIPEGNVTVNTTLLGGGFGRRGAQDFVLDAVHASRAAGAPVKVVWSREDGIGGGQYRPAAVCQLAGAVDADGWPVAWSHAFATPSATLQAEGAVELPYDIANVRVRGAHQPSAISTRPWRSVSHSIHGWVNECFVDELAAAGGKDPVELRMRLLANQPRYRRVLELAADKAGWGTPPAGGRARGVAVHGCFGSYVAEVAEVSLDERGRVVVHKVVCAADCGQVIHPDTVVAQMEGAILYGLSAALFGQVRIERGRAQQSNFHDYRVLRFPESPVIETHLVDSGEEPGGAGEPGLPPLAAAVSNAVRQLRGAPVRRLPLNG